MNYLLFILTFFIAFPVIADVVVITKSDGAVYTVAEKDDTVVPSGHSKDIIINKTIEQLQLGNDVSLYNYNGKKFTLNSARVSAKNKAEQDEIAVIETKKKDKASAIEKLKALGLTESEIEALK